MSSCEVPRACIPVYLSTVNNHREYMQYGDVFSLDATVAVEMVGVCPCSMDTASDSSEKKE